MSQKTFFSRPESKFRAAAVLGALVLGIASIFLGLSIAAALFDLPFFTFGPGDFFVRSYGFLAFMIPIYLFRAAIILADPAYRPGRIFVLSCTLFPFLTLAIGLALLRDFDALAGQLPFLALLGRVGLGFMVLVLTVFESLLIMALRTLLFPREAREKTPGSRGGKRKKGIDPKPALLFLPEEPSAPKEPGSSAPDSHAGSGGGSPKAPASQNISLPPLKPLASAEAFQDLALSPSYDVEMPDEAEPVELDEIDGETGAFRRPPAPETAPARHPAKQAAAGPETAAGLTIGPEPEWEAGEEYLPALDMEAETDEDPPFGLDMETETDGEPPFDTETEAEADDESPFDADMEAGADDESPFDLDMEAGADGETLFDADMETETDDESPFDADMETGADDESPFDAETEAGADDESPFDAETEAGAGGKILPGAEAKPLPGTETKAKAGAMPKQKAPQRFRGPYRLPVEGILNQYPDGQYWIIDQATRDAAGILKETLKEFNIHAEVTGIRKGPVITMFEILPAPGVKLSKIVNLQDNIALRLAASSVRIVAPIPGKHAVGIEAPNAKRNIVSFREIIEGELLREGKKPEIPVVLGKDITGEAQTVDLVQMPHLLIAGATGSGKSVCVNSMILSILYQKPPSECRLILIDPKIVELKLYNDIPHLLTPVITEPKRAFQALQYCIYEMERRYACLDAMGVRDIRSYNRRIRERNMASEHLPYIVVVIDEFADLMATTGKELESTVARLAAMSRAVGIHLVLATQRPSIDVITGLIKANIPSRIAFMVASKMDSRIIIDMVGAEKLLGKGDMLYAGVVDPFPVRIQGAFVSEEEVERVVEYVKTLGKPDYIDDEIFYDDEEEDLGPSLFAAG
ncbi:MAG: DNA translocase FtsK, partial [Treponema sp.]|nr:DNA translocase FtsK [Treponema sp.]